jgi:ATP-dependent exoDNAse (exonuclease V) beta subunit
MTTLPLFSLDEEAVAPAAQAVPAALDARPAPELTPEQREAVERRAGSLFVHAGAGSGKTRVLVERFVRAVVEDRASVDRMLAITFTEKAAAELRERIRARFLEVGERDHARAVDSAWISTIHGFCSRLLRAEALSAGLDPEYRVLAEHEAERIAADAFNSALEEFMDGARGADRVALVAAHGPDRLGQAIRLVHAEMRGRGERRPALPQPVAPDAQGLRRAHERLAAAVRRATDSLAGESQPGLQVRAALDRLERCAGGLDRPDPDAAFDPSELKGLAIRRGNARALRGPVFDELEEAHGTCLDLCGRERAVRDLRLLDELLGLYGERYEKLKTERSALDFDDLELHARDLLRRRPGLRERTRERFDHVLVDELQDTNRLQSDILDLIVDDNLFTVGDDLQAIYGFRGADVAVFGARRDAARADRREVRLSESFRAHPDILAVLNASFESGLSPGFAPLRPAPTDGPRRVSPVPDPPGRTPGGPARVELLVVDRDNARWADALVGQSDPFGAAMRGAPPWRAAEARLLAKRIDELLVAGEFAPADVAVLLRSWSDVGRYEQALAERGVATYVAGGGGYWSAQQVGDLRAYLATLANPRDEEALVSVLASPLVGVSLDALALLRLRAGRRGRLWDALETAFAPGEAARRDEPVDDLASAVPDADCELLRAFVERLVAERREAPRHSLPELVERAVTASGYDSVVVALPGGERRLANLRKLKRLAREFEAVEGRNLRAFLDNVDRRGLAAAREGEAPLEGEGIDAVRLMSIHAAKGLEFPLVCVGDLGRADPTETPLLRVAADGRVGLRLPDPDGGGIDALDAPALREEATRAERAEERRLLWVAATRAEQRLILSGALDLETPRDNGGSPAMEWLGPALVPDLRDAHGAGEGGGLCVRSWEGRESSVAWCALSPSRLGEILPAADRAPTDASAASVVRLAPPAAHAASPPEVAPPSSLAPRRWTTPRASTGGEITRISYSALESHRRCGYRFYLERRLGLSTEDLSGAGGARTAQLDPAGALTRGSVAHELLERLDARRPAAPRRDAVAARLRARGAAASADDVDDLVRLVEGFISSPLRARLARARSVRRELPFAFPLELPPAGGDARSVLVEGSIDALCEEGEGLLVVDYKTDRLARGADLEAVCAEAYSTQRLVYALAALRGGAPRVEVAHVFLERPNEPVLARYERAEGEELEAHLAVMVDGLVAGRYEPSATPSRDLCRGCPGRAALCSWPPEWTGAPAAAC